jgi:hypothetical protein
MKNIRVINVLIAGLMAWSIGSACAQTAQTQPGAPGGDVAASPAAEKLDPAVVRAKMQNLEWQAALINQLADKFQPEAAAQFSIGFNALDWRRDFGTRLMYQSPESLSHALNAPTLAMAQSALVSSNARAKHTTDNNWVINYLPTPCRIVDTRFGGGGVLGPVARNWTASTATPSIIAAQGGNAAGCGNFPTAQGFVVYVTVVPSVAGPNFLTVSHDPGVPTTATMTYYSQVLSNFAVTSSAGSGGFWAYASGSTHVVIDLLAWTGTPLSPDNITLANPSTATTGNIMKGANRFLHNFGGGNTFLGENAGNFTMTGTGNTAVGVEALIRNTIGVDNVACGRFALPFNTSGSGNTASGVGALFASSTGNQNVAIGQNALIANTTASANTAIGWEALKANTTGTSNIAVGFQAGALLNTGGFNIDIGNFGNAADTDTIRIGASQTRAFIAGIRGVTTGVANGLTVVIDSNGQLGTTSSSRRFKDDIADMGEASSTLMKLRPVIFHYKTDQNPKGRSLQYGLIAEEVEKVAPGLVARSASGEIETVFYQHLTPMLLNEYQKQQRTIETQVTTAKMQAERIAELEQDRNMQMARMDTLEKQAVELAALKQLTAKMAATLEQLQRTGMMTAGLQLK